MQTTLRKLVSLFMAMVFIASSLPLANAAELEFTTTDTITIFETSDTRIDYYEDEDGTMFLLQYVNNVLDQVNITYADSPDTIERHHFDASGNEVSVSVICPNDYITVSHTTTTQPYGLGYYSIFGKINYSATLDTGTINYTQAVYLITEPEYQTEYTTNRYLGPVVDLINAIISVVEIPIACLNKFFSDLEDNKIISVLSGKIIEALSMTLASLCTEYTWKIYDEDFPSNVSYYSGAKYVVNSQTKDGKYYGDTYYEGIAPVHWGTATMSTVFHNLTYGYTVWGVSSWQRYG